jgi:glycosyltransferase involved in cell wall biosynthesis
VRSNIFVVVPAYNEADRLEQTLSPLLELGYTVVVVDDGSDDATWAVAVRMPVYALRHPINLGQGAALQTGMDFAVAHGARCVVHFDADGQHDASDIEHMVGPLLEGKADVVLGSRFLTTRDIMHVPRARRQLLRVAVLVNGALTGLWLSDAHNGFRALTAEAAKKIHLNENRFAHSTEILSQIRRQRLRYTERPTTIRYTPDSMRKGQSAWNAVTILVDVLIRKVLR